MCEIWCLDGYGITVKGENRVIGLVGVNKNADWSNNWTTELGYFLSKEYRGHGYMPEAVSAICNEMFDTDGAERVMLEIRKDNIPSREVARKCGFSQNENQTHWRLNLYGKPLDEFILERGSRKCAKYQTDEEIQVYKAWISSFTLGSDYFRVFLTSVLLCTLFRASPSMNDAPRRHPLFSQTQTIFVLKPSGSGSRVSNQASFTRRNCGSSSIATWKHERS